MEAPWQTGPRGLDPHIRQRITEQPLHRYRAALRKCLGLVVRNNFDFYSIAEIDDLVVEWKHVDRVSKADFEAAIASSHRTPLGRGPRGRLESLVKTSCYLKTGAIAALALACVTVQRNEILQASSCCFFGDVPQPLLALDSAHKCD